LILNRSVPPPQFLGANTVIARQCVVIGVESHVFMT